MNIGYPYLLLLVRIDAHVKNIVEKLTAPSFCNTIMDFQLFERTLVSSKWEYFILHTLSKKSSIVHKFTKGFNSL